MAPLPPCSRKLLDETVKTYAVFPSWLHLLVGEDKCMLSVPLSTSDLHCSRWQSGEICQALLTEAFTSFCQACDGTMGSSLPRHHCLLLPHVTEDRTVLLLFAPRAPVLPTRLSARCLLSSRPDTAFIRSCLLLPHAGGWNLSRKPCVFLLLFLLDRFCT